MIQVNPFIGKVIGVVVVLIVIVSVAVPVISTLTQPETISNDAELRYSLYDAEDVPAFTIEVNHDAQTITMNGEPVDWPAQDSGYRAVFITKSYNVDSYLITNDYYITNAGNRTESDGRLIWDPETKEFWGRTSTGGSGSSDVEGIIIPDSDGNLSTFDESFWGNVGKETYLIFMNPSRPTSVVGVAVNNEAIVGNYDGFLDFSVPSVENMGDAYRYDLSQTEIDISTSVQYEIALAVGEVDVIVDDGDGDPVLALINLVPLLLVVGLIIAAVAAFITLKSRGGGA